MSSWHYIAARRSDPEGGEIWNVQEIFTGLPHGRGWTASEIGMVPYGETREVLIRDLENMLSDMHNNEYVDLDTNKVKNVLDCKREEENK